jgi:hypothetical protein
MRSASRVVGRQNWCQAKSSKGLLAVGFADQRFIAEINQHRMVLEIKPTAEDIETAVLSPSRRIGEPTRQLFDENSLAQFAQDVRNVLVSITLQYYTPGSGKLSGPEAVPATSMCGWSEESAIVGQHFGGGHRELGSSMATLAEPPDCRDSIRNRGVHRCGHAS